MLAPGQRMVDRPGALHFYDGRRVVSLRSDDEVRAAVHALVDIGQVHPGQGDAGPDEATLADLRELLTELAVLDSAEREGAVQTPSAEFASAASGSWVGRREAGERLATIRVRVLAADDEHDALAAGLRAAGLGVAGRLRHPDEVAALDPDTDLVVATAGAHQPASTLLRVNAACVARRVAWLPIGAFDGAVVRVGPLVLPGRTACFDCTLQRLAANTEFAHLYREVAADAPSAAAPAAVQAWAHAIGALLLVRWIGARDPHVPGRLLTLVPDECGIRRATVFRVPRCPVCVAPDHVPAAAPWELGRAF